jgi:hypothetical protein
VNGADAGTSNGNNILSLQILYITYILYALYIEVSYIARSKFKLKSPSSIHLMTPCIWNALDSRKEEVSMFYINSLDDVVSGSQVFCSRTKKILLFFVYFLVGGGACGSVVG